MLLLNITIWILVTCARNVIASVKLNADNNYFISPPAPESETTETPAYELGAVQEISWTTTLDIFNISIWQCDPIHQTNTSGGNIFSKSYSKQDIRNISWAIQTYAFDLDISPIFFLSIDGFKLDQGGKYSFTSMTFNITTLSSSSHPSSPSSPPDTIPNSESQSNSEPATTSLTSTGKIALGLGVGVGAPLISLLAILAYLQYRNARRDLYAYDRSAGANVIGRGYLPPSPRPPPIPPMMAQSQYQYQYHHSIPAVDEVPLHRSRGPSELMPPPSKAQMQVQPWEVHATTLGTRPERGTTRSSRGIGIPELPAQDYI